jgi:eukaryotic-like serine/threonine-protein kinase
VVPRLAPGSTFAERFRIVAHVGQGSMGSVYRAEPLEGGASVALKIVNLTATKDPRALRRFEREVESGTRIKSAYVARTLEAGGLVGGDLAWIAMEFAEGQSLTELVQERGGLDFRSAARLFEQLFSALSEAHAAGIVHRDLKPENIRVASDGDSLSVKVLDFGIAKDSGIDTLSGTAPGLGTPLWTAPEQGREGYRPAPNADVWALGLLAFFVLTGALYWRHAGERASMADLALELIKSDIEPATQRAAELGVDAALPPGFDAWFERAVQRDPERRFRDAGQAWRGLEPLLSAGAARAVSGRPSVVVRPGAFLTLVILSVVAAGLGIYWLLRSARI